MEPDDFSQLMDGVIEVFCQSPSLFLGLKFVSSLCWACNLFIVLGCLLFSCGTDTMCTCSCIFPSMNQQYFSLPQKKNGKGDGNYLVSKLRNSSPADFFFVFFFFDREK